LERLFGGFHSQFPDFPAAKPFSLRIHAVFASLTQHLVVYA